MENGYERHHIVYPGETLVALKVKPEELGAEIRLAAAVKLYELGRISSGAAAKLAGIPTLNGHSGSDQGNFLI